MDKAILDRFWSKVNKTTVNECWEWTACLNNGGYGQFKLNGRMRPAHRISWMIRHGSMPPKDGSFHGLCVLHKCDNPRCVNPDHLFVGTHGDNMRDRSKKGRHSVGNRKGTSHPLCALSNSDILLIRALGKHHKHTDIASVFCVGRAQIGRIIRRENWSHI